MRVEWLVDSSASLTVAQMVVKMVAYWVDSKADLMAVWMVEMKAGQMAAQKVVMKVEWLVDSSASLTVAQMEPQMVTMLEPTKEL